VRIIPFYELNMLFRIMDRNKVLTVTKINYNKISSAKFSIYVAYGDGQRIGIRFFYKSKMFRCGREITNPKLSKLRREARPKETDNR
jgi:hypothetical protein